MNEKMYERFKQLCAESGNGNNSTDEEWGELARWLAPEMVEEIERTTAELAALKEQTRWIPIDDFLCPSHNEKLELVVRNKFDPTIAEVIHGWWIYEKGDYSVSLFFDDHNNEVAPIFCRSIPEPPEVDSDDIDDYTFGSIWDTNETD